MEVVEGEGLESLEVESMMSPKIMNRRSRVKELEALASEVAKVERMRTSAESVLKLEQLVGDLEASIAMISSSGSASAQIGSSAASLRITRAVQRMQSTENAVAEIARANWNSLVSAVDLPVDRVAAILRPAAITDHLGVLVSIGWPPPLSAASDGGDKLANTLLDMDEDQELKYGNQPRKEHFCPPKKQVHQWPLTPSGGLRPAICHPSPSIFCTF